MSIILSRFVILFLVFNDIFCEEFTTIQSEPSNFITPLTSNNLSSEEISVSNETSEKKLAKIERIIQPVSQTVLTSTKFEIGENGTKLQSLGEFKPSPQLETYYEFNKLPVAPAVGEAKYHTGAGLRAEISAWDHHHLNQSRGSSWSVNTPWAQNNHNSPSDQSRSRPWNNQDLKSTSESPWLNRVKFPSSGERPYSFVTNQQTIKVGHGNIETNNNNNGYLPPSRDKSTADNFAGKDSAYLPPNDGSINQYTPSGNEYIPTVDNKRNQFYHSSNGVSNKEEPFAFNKPVEIPKRTYTKPYDYPIERRPTWGDKYAPTHKGGYEYNLMEKPAYPTHKTYEYEHHGVVEAPGYGLDPIKKILKLLATFIPIGLLISALTPTVITVSNVNDTDATDPMRYRSEDRKKVIAQHVISSLGYFDKLNEHGCEYRVFCELLISASNMKDSEQHVENLLNNFSKQEKNVKEKAEELKKVFDAVKNQDCSPIHCQYLKGPS